MSDKAIRDELEKLREQVAELHSTREKEPAPQEPQQKIILSQNTEPTAESYVEQTTTLVEDEATSDVEKQIRDFVDALDQEIKSTNPMTALVVFSLGVLIGRLLPR